MSKPTQPVFDASDVEFPRFKISRIIGWFLPGDDSESCDLCAEGRFDECPEARKIMEIGQ